jgi:hypothetical protein
MLVDALEQIDGSLERMLGSGANGGAAEVLSDAENAVLAFLERCVKS